jgi:hypothetical protein
MFNYHADVPDPGGAPPPVPEPAPAPAPEPASEAAPTQGGVDIDQRFQLTKDGQPTFPTLGELAQAYLDQPDKGTLDQFGLYKKAVVDQDTEAAQQLLQSFGVNAPAEPAAPSTPEAQEIASLKEQLEQLQAQVGNHNPIIQRAVESQELNLLGQAIQGEAEKYPLLGKHPMASQLVRNRLNEIRQIAYQRNIDLNQDQNLLKQAVDRSFSDIESFLSQTAQALGLTPETAHQSPAYVSVNDQTPGDQGGTPPAGFGEGNYVPPRMTVDLNPNPHVVGGQQPPVPNQPVMAPTGAGPVQQPMPSPHETKFTLDQLRQQVASRRSQLEGGAR